MDWINFTKGFVIGISIAAPVGPIGVLCIRRTLTSGWISGLVTGMGAATADALYGSVAAFGLTFISIFMLQQQVWLRLAGGLFLCFLGIRTWLARPSRTPAQADSVSWLRAYTSTFVLTLTNPLTILSFSAIFAGLGVIKASSGYVSAAITVAGVFLGSSSWWVILSSATHFFRSRLTPTGLTWVNRISGLIILGFGVFALLSAISLIRSS